MNVRASVSPSFVRPPPDMTPCLLPRPSALANASRNRIEQHPEEGGSPQASLRSQPEARGRPSGTQSWLLTPGTTPVSCPGNTRVLDGASGRARKGGGGGMTSWSKSGTHFASLASQHPADNMRTKTTKTAVLNSFLLHSGAKAEAEGEAEAEAEDAATAAPDGGTLAPKRGPAFQAVRDSTGGTFSRGEAGGETRFTTRQQHDVGPLPSIARLVEASALVGGAGRSGEWGVRPSPLASVRCD